MGVGGGDRVSNLQNLDPKIAAKKIGHVGAAASLGESLPATLTWNIHHPFLSFVITKKTQLARLPLVPLVAPDPSPQQQKWSLQEHREEILNYLVPRRLWGDEAATEIGRAVGTMAEEELEKYKRLYEEQKAKVKELERQNSQLKVRICVYDFFYGFSPGCFAVNTARLIVL